MSEQKPEKKVIRKLKFEEVVSFLKEKNQETKCPVCDGGSWVVLLDEDSEDDIVNRIKLYIAHKPSKVYSAFGAVCDNCGFIRLHHAGAVFNWLDNNDGDSEPESEGQE